MTTEKQNEANQENAQLSTGPKTEEGKLIVSQNAIKHGIFTKELIIEHGDGREDLKEYEELLQNLMAYFNPQGQLEATLVEKIAVDFWRLKRVIRFETGSIRATLDHIVEKYYDNDIYGSKPINKNDAQLDEEIADLRDEMDWDQRFLKCLEENKVDLTKDKWEGEDLEADIEEDLFQMAEKMEEQLDLDRDIADATPFLIRKALERAGFEGQEGLRKLFIPHYRAEIQRVEREIIKKEVEKSKNRLREEVEKRRHALPTEESSEKVLRYERSIEKSIFQKIVMLKNLQGTRAV